MRIDWNIDGKQDGRINFLIPRKTSYPTGNKEGLKILHGLLHNHITQYPRKCTTDEKRFIHLKRLFFKDEIGKDMFIEFAEVLKFRQFGWKNKKEEKIEEAIDEKVSQIDWSSEVEK